jgi:SAM-dependent methyltransferase
MSQNPTPSDWAASRGEKWRDRYVAMEAMLAPVTRPVVEALRLTAPCRIADIGCGAGGATLEILHRAPAGSTVHGFDISPALVEVARNRLQPADRAAFHLADMATAPAPAELYDRLASRFGVMFFDHPPAAFNNLATWLAPGGCFAFAVWGPLPENPWMTTIRDVASKIIDLPKPDPEAPGPFRYAEAAKLLHLLANAGLANLNVSAWRGSLPLGGGLPAPAAADFALGAFSSFGELLAEAGEDALTAARTRLTERFATQEREGAVTLDASVHIVTGTRH